MKLSTDLSLAGINSGDVGAKVQMPKLNSNASSSIQTTNGDTITSSVINKETGDKAKEANSSTMINNYNPPVAIYKTAAPKFISAGSLKIQQARAFNSKNSG